MKEKLTLAEDIKLAELEARGQILTSEKLAVLDSRRHAREAWEGAARTRTALQAALVGEPVTINSEIARLAQSILGADEIQAAAVTAQALAGWRAVETFWPERKARLETEIDALDARIAELQEEEGRHQKREAQLQKDIDGIKRDAAKITGT